MTLEPPEHIDNREEFGHLEGDLVIGLRDGKLMLHTNTYYYNLQSWL